jgi:predicted Rossmann-fold nucleotide-binding protein
VASGDAVIALGGAWGTLSEIALARAIGRPVVLLASWGLTPPDGAELDGVRTAQTPLQAVDLALQALRHH